MELCGLCGLAVFCVSAGRLHCCSTCVAEQGNRSLLTVVQHALPPSATRALSLICYCSTGGPVGMCTQTQTQRDVDPPAPWACACPGLQSAAELQCCPFAGQAHQRSSMACAQGPWQYSPPADQDAQHVVDGCALYDSRLLGKQEHSMDSTRALHLIRVSLPVDVMSLSY